MKYLTTPIYYANDVPHVGSAYTTLAADVFNRYWQLKGNQTFFLTGTDEHGAKMAEAAANAGKEPAVFVTEMAAVFQGAWKDLNIKPDGFIRTSDPAHEKYVQEFLAGLYTAGHIYKGHYRGWYCVSCEEFKTESQIGPGNTCLIHKRDLTEIEEEAYLFKLAAFKEKLVELISSDILKIHPESRRNEVLGFIEHEGLRDVAISRQNVSWGIPVPWDKNHTVYVWVDALINYLSAAEALDFNGKKPEFPPTLQLIGKDILRFHAIIWPALLLSAGKSLPTELFVHGYFTIDGQKMSKSLGNTITPAQLIERYGVDGSRYVLMAAVPFGADGDIGITRFDEIYGSDLANNLGNLVNRTITMIDRYRGGNVPHSSINELDRSNILQIYDDSLKTHRLDKALMAVKLYMDQLNSYIEQQKPWGLSKLDDPVPLDDVLTTLASHMVTLAVLLAPFIPDSSSKIARAFGTSISRVNYDTLVTGNLTAGTTVEPLDPLFPRIG